MTKTSCTCIPKPSVSVRSQDSWNSTASTADGPGTMQRYRPKPVHHVSDAPAVTRLSFSTVDVHGSCSRSHLWPTRRSRSSPARPSLEPQMRPSHPTGHENSRLAALLHAWPLQLIDLVGLRPCGPTSQSSPFQPCSRPNFL